MNIKFSPPDISQLEIDEVVDAMKSGWITTGPKTKNFEKEIANYCGTPKAVCLNSATAGLELILRLANIGEGDEVITSAYTYTASASVIKHVGAKIVLCDIQENSLEMDYKKLASLITDRTKAIIGVDIAGIVANYNEIINIANKCKNKFKAKGKIQEALGRIIVIADAAHSFGAYQNGLRSGSIADFTSFSFHAVKNLTTAEGGAVVWKNIDSLDNDGIYKNLMNLSLHGQNKDALEKNKSNSWEYDILTLGYKCNMTDIMASIGLAQLKRYENMLKRRKEIFDRYVEELSSTNMQFVQQEFGTSCGSYHLCLANIKTFDEKMRNEFISKVAERGVPLNVHYKPLPMFTAYKKEGFKIDDFPVAYNRYRNIVTLPLHTLLQDDEVAYIIQQIKEVGEIIGY